MGFWKLATLGIQGRCHSRPMRCRECRRRFLLGKRQYISLCPDCRQKKIDAAIHITEVMIAFEETWERHKEGLLYLAGR